MHELVKMLDENLEYISHEILGNRIYIYTQSSRDEAACPYCGHTSIWAHSRYPRTLQDLPIQGKKVTIIINNRKFFCKNSGCSHKTFAENFDFVKPKATKTNRLQDAIMSVSLNQSSVSAAEYLRKSTCDIGKSTICNLLKKTNQ